MNESIFKLIVRKEIPVNVILASLAVMLHRVPSSYALY